MEKEFYKNDEYERRLDGFSSCRKILAANIESLTSVFGKGTGVSNLLWPSPKIYQEWYL